MPRNVIPTLPPSHSRKKRKIQPVSYAKKVRSKIPRRKRIPLFPIIKERANELVEATETVLSGFAAASSASSCFPGEFSSISTMIPIGSEIPMKKRRSNRRRKENMTIEILEPSLKSPAVDFRRITRSYYKKIRDIGKTNEEGNAEDQNWKWNVYYGRNTDLNAETCTEAKSAENAASAITLSGISRVGSLSREDDGSFYKIDKFTDGNSTADVQVQMNAVSGIGLSENSCVESVSGANAGNLRQSGGNLSGKAKKFAESTAEKKKEDLEFDCVMACSEELSGDDSAYSTCPEMTLSQLEAEIFPENYYTEFSDCSPSMFHESSDVFSENSDGHSVPSASFSLFLQYKQQLLRLEFASSSIFHNEYLNEFILLKFEDEEHEESYKKFRSRERKDAFTDDYADDSSAIEYGELVAEQRLLMVKWIAARSSENQLQSETLFLGVSLFDRFLCRGFFKNYRNLQILGIACCTLATRLEENQPLNRVRQMTFQVGDNVYHRQEIVGMEWLIQDVLDFKCFAPTIYNFLWFYLKAARADEQVEKRAKHLATLSLLDQDRLSFWPSSVAAGLVILACLAVNRDSSCQWVMETHVRTANDDLSECIQSLGWLVKYVYPTGM